MVIKIGEILKTKDGTKTVELEWTEADGKKSPLKLGRLIGEALSSACPGPNGDASGEEKYRRGKLAISIFNDMETQAPTFRFSLTEMALITHLIGALYPPRFVTAAWDLLEDAESGQEE